MRRTASHSVVCQAAPEQVHRLVTRTADWPSVLQPCEAVTVLSSGDDGEHVAITARVGGVAMTWESRRRFRPELLGVDAEIVKPMPLVARMATAWRVVDLGDGRSLLLLEHDYDLCDDVTGLVPGVATQDEAAAFIAAGIDTNSRAELDDLRRAAERAQAERDRAGLVGHARHTVVCAAPADQVYPLVRGTDTWPRIFAACVGATVLESDADGELVRIEALQDGRTVAWDTQRRYHDDILRVDYHLPVPMPLLAAMHGQWRVVPVDEGHCVLTVDRHWTVLPDVIGIVPGVSTPAEAGAFVAAFVDTNATAEMVAIRALVEEPAHV